MGTAEREGEDWEPRIAAFNCSWCSSLAADLAGSGGRQYPANVRVIRVPCSGRVNPLYIIKALQEGFDGVLITGCHPGDCHYVNGNLIARRKLAVTKGLLEYLGIEPERVRVSWVSGSEGSRFAALVAEVVEDVRRLGPAKRLVRQCVA